MAEWTAELLQALSPIFTNLDFSICNDLCWTNSIRARQVPQGAQIATVGERCSVVYFIVEGTVKSTSQTADHEIDLSVGDTCCADAVLADDGLSTENLVVSSDQATLLHIDSSVFGSTVGSVFDQVHEVIEFYRCISALESLSAAETRRLALLTIVRTLPAGSTIIDTEMLCESLYLVARGSVHKTGESGSSEILPRGSILFCDVLGPGNRAIAQHSYSAAAAADGSNERVVLLEVRAEHAAAVFRATAKRALLEEPEAAGPMPLPQGLFATAAAPPAAAAAAAAAFPGLHVSPLRGLGTAGGGGGAGGAPASLAFAPPQLSIVSPSPGTVTRSPLFSTSSEMLSPPVTLQAQKQREVQEQLQRHPAGAASGSGGGAGDGGDGSMFFGDPSPRLSPRRGLPAPLLGLDAVAAPADLASGGGGGGGMAPPRLIIHSPSPATVLSAPRFSTAHNTMSPPIVAPPNNGSGGAAAGYRSLRSDAVAGGGGGRGNGGGGGGSNNSSNDHSGSKTADEPSMFFGDDDDIGGGGGGGGRGGGGARRVGGASSGGSLLPPPLPLAVGATPSLLISSPSPGTASRAPAFSTSQAMLSPPLVLPAGGGGKTQSPMPAGSFEFFK